MIKSYHWLGEENTSYFHCENWMVTIIHLIILKSPSPKDALCQIWLNLPSNSGEEDHSFSQCILLLCSYFPLQKDMALHLNKFELPSLKMLCVKYSWNWPSGSGEQDENVKSFTERQTDRETMDARRSEKHTSFKLRELKLSWHSFPARSFLLE